MKSVYAAVIGGGAAGMMCAIRAAGRHPDKRVLIIEKADRVGKKLLVTGNGRCNLSNTNASPAAYHGEGSDALIRTLFESYPPACVTECFNRLGLPTYADAEGRVYPRTNLASSVLDVLRLQLRLYGVEERCGAAVTGVKRREGGYELLISGEPILAEKLVIAAGGRADYAGRDSGASEILGMLRLPTTPLSPSLSPVRVRDDGLRSLKGIRADARVTLTRGTATLKSERGEVQFTENALSGICVFNLSREANRGGCAISLDLLPDLSREEVRRDISARIKRLSSSPVTELFIGLFHKNLGLYLLKRSGIPLTALCQNITEKDIHTIVRHIRDCRFTCEKSADFRRAQVTAGGVRLSAVDPLTFESRAQKDLYIIGEALDIDGDCGGYNLQFAWASGMCAGDSL